MRLVAALFVPTLAIAAHTYDVVVYGGTPGGISAAVTAARLGRSVALIEYHPHIGGMSASGLGKSDIETRDAIGGVFREFVGRVRDHYVERYGPDSENVRLSRDGYYYEPSVAEAVFDRMVRDAGVAVYRSHRLDEVIRSHDRVTGLRVVNRETGQAEEFRAEVFVDATYEGDLAAFAGARFRLGRESRRDFNELHAGVVYQDHNTRRFLPGTTGEGDHRLQAYTFRLCLTTDGANSYRLERPPPDYDRSRYLGYVDDWKAGRLDAPSGVEGTKTGRGYFAPTFGTLVRALSITEIPNGKTDVNMNPRPLGFPFSEENEGYPVADWQERERITERIRNITLGLLYFLQNDPIVPAEHRALANRYHMAKDEFQDNNHFPWQLYVREARRIVGLYTFSEHDVILGPELGRARVHPDSVAAGEFPLDSFPVRKRQAGHDTALEGYILMLDDFTNPYQLPYRIMVPEKVDGLLVPVAVSATHVAFSTVRMEPTWMALGQAAGAAAHLAVGAQVEPRDVDVGRLQRLLLSDGQVITYFSDIDTADPAFEALQYYGTKGFFDDYTARSDEPLTRDQAARWVGLAGEESPNWQGPELLTRAELAEWLGDTSIEWAVRDNRDRHPADPVRRGEFCLALYKKSRP